MKNKLLFFSSVLLAAVTGCGKASTDDPTPAPELPVAAVKNVLNLTPDFIAGVTGAEIGQKYNCGDTLSLELTPGEILYAGFAEAHMQHIFVHVADTVYTATFPDTTEEYVQTLPIDIVVPNTPSFEVDVVYSVQQQISENGATLKLVDTEDDITLLGVHPDLKYKYFDCYLRTPDSYTITNVEVKIGDGDWQNLEDLTGCGFNRTEAYDWLYNLTIRPDYQDITEDVLVRVKGTQHNRYTITWKGTEHVRPEGSEEWVKNEFPSEAIDGEYVAASFYTEEGYYLAGATSNVEGLELNCISRAYVTFTMPASDVEISLSFLEKIGVSYTESANITDAAIYDQPDIYYGVPTTAGIPGEAVYLFANAAEGYKPANAFVNGTAYKFQIYGGGLDKYAYYAAVTLPEDGKGPFTITADATKAYTVSGESGVFSFTEGTIFSEGETVNFSIYVPSGKTLESVSGETEDGTNVDITLDNTYGSFVMPASNVKLSATFSDVDEGNTVHISAIYDEEEYKVSSQTNPYYQQIESDGLDVPAGTTLYINIVDDYGEAFWVGVKMGDEVTYYEATIDPDWGDATFGKSFVFTDDTVFKVGPTENSVKFEEESSDKVSVKATFDPDEFIVKSSTNFDWDFSEGFTVDKGTGIYLTVQNMYGDSFWVGIKIGSEVSTLQATEDEDTGEFVFNKSITASDNVEIKVGYSETSVAF